MRNIALPMACQVCSLSQLILSAASKQMTASSLRPCESRAAPEATQAFSGRDRYDDDFTLVVVRRP